MINNILPLHLAIILNLVFSSSLNNFFLACTSCTRLTAKIKRNRNNFAITSFPYLLITKNFHERSIPLKYMFKIPVINKRVRTIYPANRNFNPVAISKFLRSVWSLIAGNNTAGRNNIPPIQKLTPIMCSHTDKWYSVFMAGKIRMNRHLSSCPANDFGQVVCK